MFEGKIAFPQSWTEQQIEQGYDLVRIGSDESKVKHAAWYEKQKASKAVDTYTEQPANEN